MTTPKKQVAKKVVPTSAAALSTAHRQLLETFDALPADEQFAVVGFLTERRQGVVPVAHHLLPPYPVATEDAIAAAFWLNAIGEHQAGYPDRLANMVARGAPLNGVAGSYLRDLVVESCKRHTRGRPKKIESGVPVEKFIKLVAANHAIRLHFEGRREAWRAVSKEQRGGSTPTQKALQDIMETFGLSEAGAKRAALGPESKLKISFNFRDQ